MRTAPRDTIAGMHKQPYACPQVRDLAWSLTSPPLLSPADTDLVWPNEAWFRRITPPFTSHLLELDREPAQLTRFIGQRKDRRLGAYFEQLWQYWLEHDARYQLLHANLPVRDQTRTLGEFDLIVRDRERGKTLHWELALKFYLCDSDPQNPRWWGPARRDRLDIKLERLHTRQTQLSRKSAARQLLKQLGIVIDERWVILKGRLFYPLQTTPASPADAAPHHLRGFWCTARQLGQLPESRWKLLQRDEWLAPVTVGDDRQYPDTTDLIDWYKRTESHQPVCVAMLRDGVEADRGFIVSDAWAAIDSDMTVPCQGL